MASEQGKNKKIKKKDYYWNRKSDGSQKSWWGADIIMSEEPGYEHAKNLLKEHFDNEIKIAAAYMKKSARLACNQVGWCWLSAWLFKRVL